MKSKVCWVAVASLGAMLAVSSCDEKQEPVESETNASEPQLKYYGVPYDPCAVIDLAGAEELLGPLEYDGYFNSAEHEPDYMMTGSASTWCSAWFDDGTDQRARLTISVFLERETVGDVSKASEQEYGVDSGLRWAYATEDPDEFESYRDQLPDPIILSVDSEWPSSEVVQFPEVKDDTFGWDPNGKSLAVNGTFAEDNVWVDAEIWRYGTGAAAAPDPEPYASLLTNLIDQLRAKCEINGFYAEDLSAP